VPLPVQPAIEPRPLPPPLLTAVRHGRSCPPRQSTLSLPDCLGCRRCRRPRLVWSHGRARQVRRHRLRQLGAGMHSRALRQQRRRQKLQRRLIDHPRFYPCRRRWFSRLLAFNRGRLPLCCLRPRKMHAYQPLILSLLPVHLGVHGRKRAPSILRLHSRRLWATLLPEDHPPLHQLLTGCRATSCRATACGPTRCPSTTCPTMRYLRSRFGPIHGRLKSSRTRPPRRVARRRSWVSGPRLQRDRGPKHPHGGQGQRPRHWRELSRCL